MSTVGGLPRTREELDAGLDHVRAAPAETGRLELIVCRPGIDKRIVLDEGELTLELGLAGDNWRARGNPKRAGSMPNPDLQLTVMSSRVIALVAGLRARWPLAGDQLYVDFDLSTANLPAGSRLAIGDAVIQVSELPHTGCAKFAARFGKDALAFIGSAEGKALRLRGFNARVVTPGRIRPGDAVRKISSTAG